MAWLPVGLGLMAVGLAYTARDKLKSWVLGARDASSSGVKTAQTKAPGLSPVAAVARGLITERGAPQGSPAWEALMGGPEGPPGHWPRWSEGQGTTCGVIVAGIMGAAGAPTGYLSGGLDSIKKFAESRGELLQPIMPEELQPGDVYRLTGPDHVGVVLENDGKGTLITADGGAHDNNMKQMARRWKRTYTPSTPILSRDGDVRALIWAARWSGKP